MTRASLPGTLPGLLRRGAPVWWRDEETPYVVTAGYTDADGAAWVIAAPCAGIPLGVQDDPSNFVLDLGDPLGMDIAARWLAERVGLVVGATAPHWWQSGVDSAWHLSTPDADATFAAEQAPWHSRRFRAVPGISTLTDPAAALAAACLAVGGAS